MAAYRELRPLSSHGTLTVRPMFATVRTDYLQLAGGERVYYPEDLIPVVRRRSPTARAAEESASSRHLTTILRVTGVLTAIAGGVIVLAPTILDSDPDGNLDWTPVLVGSAISLVGILVAWLSAIPAGNANDEKNTAFATYDEALRRRLRLCAEGDDCQSGRRDAIRPVEIEP